MGGRVRREQQQQLDPLLRAASAVTQIAADFRAHSGSRVPRARALTESACRAFGKRAKHNQRFRLSIGCTSGQRLRRSVFPACETLKTPKTEDRLQAQPLKMKLQK
eukprot:Tamp_24082.p1 GENE.Tamp_24082~~Tamp_24082.p1  ORF type:complete len:106 (-),score=12.15 Tamp_24082:25-342(-)